MQMTVHEVETYGRDVQHAISEGVGLLVEAYKQTNYKVAESGLKRLGKLSSKLSTYSGTFGGVFKRTWERRLDGLDTDITELEALLSGEIANLENVLAGCENNVKLLEMSSTALTEVLDDLGSWEEETYDADLDVYNAVIQREKVLGTTLELVQMEMEKSGIVMNQNRAVLGQLIEARENVLPMVRIMWMNIIASRATVEALRVQKSLKAALNGLIVQNAKQIEQNAKEIESEGNSTLISAKSLELAAQSLEKARNQIVESKRLLGSEGLYSEE